MRAESITRFLEGRLANNFPLVNATHCRSRGIEGKLVLFAISGTLD